MKVEIADATVDVHALHSGHMLLDTYDLIVLAYVLGLVVFGGLCMYAGWRLRRKDPTIMDAKKSE